MSPGKPVKPKDVSPGRYALVIDDDALMPKVIEAAIKMPVVALTTVTDLESRIRGLNPVALFVDVHLADGGSGIEALPWLRDRFPRKPILVMTSDGEEERVAEALAAGADDFLQKPLRPRELLARLQARLAEHARSESRAVRRSADVRLDSRRRELSGPAGRCALSPLDVALLGELIDAKGTVLSRRALRRAGWGDVTVTENALDRRIHELRRRLEDVGSRLSIETSHGKGFRLGSRRERKAS